MHNSLMVSLIGENGVTMTNIKTASGVQTKVFFILMYIFFYLLICFFIYLDRNGAIHITFGVKTNLKFRLSIKLSVYLRDNIVKRQFLY